MFWSVMGALICAALQVASAATVVLPGDYGLRLIHRSIAPPSEPSSHVKPGLALELTLINAGAKDLHDIRIFLVQADGVGLAAKQEPARVRSLPVGGQAVMAVTFSTHATTRVSVDSSGGQLSSPDNGSPYNGSFSTVIASDGRAVVFNSTSNFLVGDVNEEYDAFVRDLTAGTTTLVSNALPSTGLTTPSGGAYQQRRFPISSDGRLVAFESTYLAFASAEPLLPGDLNGDRGATDIFVYDRVTQKISRMSESSSGEAGNSFSSAATMSAGGRYVSFQSFSDNLVNDGNFGTLYVHDRLTGLTIRAFGEKAYPADFPAISGDGSSIVFMSFTDGVLPTDLNNAPDVFLEKRRSFPAVLRINAGGPAYTDVAGREWSADKGHKTQNPIIDAIEVIPQ